MWQIWEAPELPSEAKRRLYSVGVVAWRGVNRAIQKISVTRAIQTLFQSAQIAVLMVPRQQAHHKLSFGIIFSPQLSTSGSGRAIQTMLFRQFE